MRRDLPAPVKLAFDAGGLLDEENHCVNRRLSEMHGQRRVVKLAMQLVDLVDQQFHALDLHLGSGEAVEDGAIEEFGAQHMTQENANDFAVAHHVARVNESPRLRALQQIADDDRRTGESAGLHDKLGVRSFARTGRAAQQNDLLGKTQLFVPEILFKLRPDGVENEPRVLDLEGLARSFGPGFGSGFGNAFVGTHVGAQGLTGTRAV